METFDGILRDALIATALLTLPLLIAATVVGAAVAVLQAATGVQEQTLTLLPKLLCVAGFVALFGRAGLALAARLFVEIVARIPVLAGG